MVVLVSWKITERNHSKKPTPLPNPHAAARFTNGELTVRQKPDADDEEQADRNLAHQRAARLQQIAGRRVAQYGDVIHIMVDEMMEHDAEHRHEPHQLIIRITLVQRGFSLFLVPFRSAHSYAKSAMRTGTDAEERSR